MPIPSRQVAPAPNKPRAASMESVLSTIEDLRTRIVELDRSLGSIIDVVTDLRTRALPLIEAHEREEMERRKAIARQIKAELSVTDVIGP